MTPAESVLQVLKGSSQHADLRKRLSDRGMTASALAELSKTSRADVSNYLIGKLEKIGGKRQYLILEALIALGIEKPREKKTPTCRKCGVQDPLGEQPLR